ncbi:MAG: hypothetical protein V3T03_07665, partial [Candidatus Bipolaricaulota bacterium]
AEERGRQIGDGEVVAFALLTDLPVLAVDTSDVAAGEENSARTEAADKRALFAEVRTEAGDLRVGADAATPELSLDTIDAAFVRTQTTRREQRAKHLRAFV